MKKVRWIASGMFAAGTCVTGCASGPRPEGVPVAIEVVASGEGLFAGFHVTSDGAVVIAAGGQLVRLEADGTRPVAPVVVEGAMHGLVPVGGLLALSEGRSLAAAPRLSFFSELLEPGLEVPLDESCLFPAAPSESEVLCWNGTIQPSADLVGLDGTIRGAAGTLGVLDDETLAYAHPREQAIVLVRGDGYSVLAGRLDRPGFTTGLELPMEVSRRAPLGFLGADLVMTDGTLVSLNSCEVLGGEGYCADVSGALVLREDRRFVATDARSADVLYAIEGEADAPGDRPCIDRICHAQAIDGVSHAILEETAFLLEDERARVLPVARYDASSRSLLFAVASDCGTVLCPTWTVYRVPLGSR